MRSNKIEKLEELRKISIFSTLKTLIITSNPIIDKLGDNWMFEVLPNFRKVVRLNKSTVGVDLLEKLFYFEKEKLNLEREKEKEKEKEQTIKNDEIVDE